MQEAPGSPKANPVTPVAMVATPHTPASDADAPMHDQPHDSTRAAVADEQKELLEHAGATRLPEEAAPADAARTSLGTRPTTRAAHQRRAVKA